MEWDKRFISKANGEKVGSGTRGKMGDPQGDCDGYWQHHQSRSFPAWLLYYVVL